MSDRREGSAAAPGALALALLLSACQTLGPAEPPPGGDGGTPCSASAAVATGTVAVAVGACNPGCIRVPAGSSVTFINQDRTEYLFSTSGPPAFDLIVPSAGSASTPALLTAGTVVIGAVHHAATVTVLVE